MLRIALLALAALQCALANAQLHVMQFESVGTGASPWVGPAVPVNASFTFTAPGVVGMNPPVLGADGTVYGYTDRVLFALMPFGAQLWMYSYWADFFGHGIPALLGNDVLLMGTYASALASNASTGNPLWQFADGVTTNAPTKVLIADGLSPPIAVLAGRGDAENGVLLGFNALTGIAVWSATLPYPPTRSVLISNGSLLCASPDVGAASGTVVISGFDVSTGVSLWMSVPVFSAVPHTVLAWSVCGAGVLLALQGGGTVTYTLYAINSGNALWTFSQAVSDAAVVNTFVGTAVLYVALGAELSAHNVNSGASVWNVSLPASAPVASGTVDAFGDLIIASKDKSGMPGLSKIKAASGAVAWSFAMSKDGVLSNIIITDAAGSVYVSLVESDTTFTVYALGRDKGWQLWSVPYTHNATRGGVSVVLGPDELYWTQGDALGGISHAV